MLYTPHYSTGLSTFGLSVLQTPAVLYSSTASYNLISTLESYLDGTRHPS
jgi:hypothetical protein